MDAFFDLSWRLYPASVLMLLGVCIALRGVRNPSLHRSQQHPSNTALLYRIQGFRMAIIGLALVAAGIAWETQQLWLLVVALGVGGEEILESSFYIWALKQERKRLDLSVERGR